MDKSMSDISSIADSSVYSWNAGSKGKTFTCIVPGCGHNSSEEDVFHSKSAKQTSEWKMILEAVFPSDNFNRVKLHVCKCHFETDQFQQNPLAHLLKGNSKLIKDAIPSFDVRLERMKFLVTENERIKEDYAKLEKEFQEYRKSMERFLTEDMIAFALIRDNPKKKKLAEWSPKSLEVSLKILQHVSPRGYEYLCQLGYPLPLLYSLTKATRRVKERGERTGKTAALKDKLDQMLQEAELSGVTTLGLRVNTPKRKACGQCANCIKPNCGKCYPCKQKPEFGGKGTRGSKKCRERTCLVVKMVSNEETTLKRKERLDAIKAAKKAKTESHDKTLQGNPEANTSASIIDSTAVIDASLLTRVSEQEQHQIDSCQTRNETYTITIETVPPVDMTIESAAPTSQITFQRPWIN